MSTSGWIGVDLDGTLAEYHGWNGCDQIGAPIPLMVERVKNWLAGGVDVRIFTARAHSWMAENDEAKRQALYEEIIVPIRLWCDKVFGQPLPVTCVKDFGMIELWDDRAFGVECNTGRLRSWPLEVK